MLSARRLVAFGHKISVLSLVILVALMVPDRGLGQGETPWWKNLFQGAGRTEVPIQQPDEEQMDSIANPEIDSRNSTQESVDQPISEGLIQPADIARPHGTVNKQCDPRVLALDSAWHSEPHPVQGYRIQIFSGSLQAAREVRANARKINSTSTAYLSSMPPNYRVTIGDFRTKWEAQQAQDFWLDAFPLSLVIPMEINLPPLQHGGLPRNQD